MPKRTLYKGQIVKQLFFSEGLSCLDLSTRLCKSLPFINGLLNELIAEGLVIETGYAASTGGRRPLIYALKSEMLYVIAVAMDQFVTRIALMDMQSRRIISIRLLELDLAKNSTALEELASNIGDVIKNAGIGKSQLTGIGIGMPGFVNAKMGINHTFLQHHSKSISDYVSSQTGLPVFIDNDSSVVALAEFRFGAARTRKNAMVVNLGWGIGLGMVLDEKLFRGNSGFAGEFSHIPLFTNGKLCNCGKHGCLETEASLLTITEKARQGILDGKLSRLTDQMKHDSREADCDALLTAAAHGDRFAVSVLAEAGYIIGRGLAILIHIINPEVIILSGRGAAAGRLWLAPMQQALNEHCIPKLAECTSLEISPLGVDAEIVGAAALVMEHYDQVFVHKSDLFGAAAAT
jgi:predicted NBD/HSP70 family sugar kinase